MIQRLRTKREQDEAGFTLVELLVVIVILGILAAIVVFAVGGITDKGTVNAKATDVSSLQAAEEAYFAADKVVPPTYATMTVLQNGFLRTASTYNAICLSPAVAASAGPPVVVAQPRGTDYFVIAQNSPSPWADNSLCDGRPGAPASKVGYTIGG